jgi:hypothetical protein
MGEERRNVIECMLYCNLYRRIAEMFFSTDNVGYFHLNIVYGGSEIVSRYTRIAQNDRVANTFAIPSHRATDKVIHNDFVIGHFETYSPTCIVPQLHAPIRVQVAVVAAIWIDIVFTRTGRVGISQTLLYHVFGNFLVMLNTTTLEEVFKDTCGLLIFQEQLQFIYNKMAGVPLEDTDGVRKAFTKKDIQNKEKAAFERQKLKEDFIKLCKDKNNIAENITSPLFDEMEVKKTVGFKSE